MQKHFHPDDPELPMPIFLGVFAPAPPREHKPMVTKPRGKPGSHPQAPLLDKRKTRRAIVRAALEDFITESQAPPHEKGAARSLLREIGRIERLKPDTTVCGILRLSGTRTSVWVYEKELTPSGSTIQAILTHNAYLDRAARQARA